LANQTLKEFEIVLVNDGGEDVSGLLHSFEPQFPVEYVYHETSKGRTAAINTGIQYSKGAWLAYLDDDDIIYPWHLESLFQAVQQSGEKFVYSNCNSALFPTTTASSPIVLRGIPPWEYKRSELLVQNYIPIHTWMHARECIDRVGLWKENLDRLEDYEFLLRVSAKYNFKHLNKVTSEYRYYLDSVNSISNGRHEYVAAIQDIYKQHPVSEPNLLVQRQQIIDGIRNQAKKIDELNRNIGDSEEEEMYVARQIISIVTGM
jgi:glycosyltransferase involved in cell wall biosynthesis